MLRNHRATRIAIHERKRRNLARGIRKVCTCLCLALAFAVCIPAPARADGVSGRVLGPDAKPLVNMTFTAQPASGSPVDFKTDGAGNFSIYLDPGKYKVVAKGNKSLEGFEGVIESYSQPAQQDVHLKKVR